MRQKSKNLTDIKLVLFKICLGMKEIIVRHVYEEMLKIEPKSYMTIKTEMDRIVKCNVSAANGILGSIISC
jgi:hypothetical protein